MNSLGTDFIKNLSKYILKIPKAYAEFYLQAIVLHLFFSTSIIIIAYYRVTEFKLYFFKQLWRIEIGKLDLVWSFTRKVEMWTFMKM